MIDSMHLSSVSSGDFRIKFQVQPGKITHNYDRFIFQNQPNFHAKASACRLCYTQWQAAVCTAVCHSPTRTDFVNQFQPKAFCILTMAWHVTGPTHPPLSYHPNNTWRCTPSQNPLLYIIYLHCETTFRPSPPPKPKYNYLLYVTPSAFDWEPARFGWWSLIVHRYDRAWLVINTDILIFFKKKRNHL